MARIRKPVEVLVKNKKGYGYTYTDEEEILSKITGLMDKYDVSLIPKIIHGTTSLSPYHYLKTKSTKNGDIYEEHVNEILVKSDMDFVWINNENPQEYIEVPWALVGHQSDASQAFGSGLTYCTRYFLLKYFNVSTSDNDPDEYRRKQREAEDMEDKLVAERIVEKIHDFVTKHLEEKPDDRAKVMTLTKKFVKENGKATANYFSIAKPDIATSLFEALKKEFSGEVEEVKKETKKSNKEDK